MRGSKAAHQGPTNCIRSGLTTCNAGHELIIHASHARIIVPLEVDVMQCVNRMFVSLGFTHAIHREVCVFVCLNVT